MMRHEPSQRGLLPVGALLLSTLSFLACTAGPSSTDEETGDGDGDIPSGDGDGDTIGDGDGDGDTVHTGEQGHLEDVRSTCEASAVGAPVLRRLTQGEVDVTLRDIFNLDGWLGVKLSPDPTSNLGFTNDASVLVVGGTTAREMLKTAEEVADLVVEQLPTVLPCSASSPDRACVTEFINTYGLRLFRRPLSADEVTRYADHHESIAGRSDFATGMKWMLTAMIQSPHAFYRSEIGVDAGDGTRQLDNYEMATELSYMMVGSTPDEPLLNRAAAGELSDPVVRAAEAERLLSDHARRRDGIRTFFNEWLRFRTVLGQSREDDPLFAQDISPLMVEETRYFLDTLVLGDRGTIQDLMLADFTALNDRLSQFYGYGGVSNAEFDRVTRPPEYGRGILAQGSLLAATSHQAYSSPTQRGLMVTERFLCMEAPPVPAVIPPLEDSIVGTAAVTTREKYETAHAAPGSACGECHLQFEPFGYIFENFDETGRVRTMDEGQPVNTVVTNAPMPDGTLRAFNNIDELSELVNTSDVIQNCFSGMLAAYMYSGASGQACLAEDTRALVATGEMSIYDYIISLTAAPHFSQRQ